MTLFPQHNLLSDNNLNYTQILYVYIHQFLPIYININIPPFLKVYFAKVRRLVHLEFIPKILILLFI